MMNSLVTSIMLGILGWWGILSDSEPPIYLFLSRLLVMNLTYFVCSDIKCSLFKDPCASHSTTPFFMNLICSKCPMCRGCARTGLTKFNCTKILCVVIGCSTILEQNKEQWIQCDCCEQRFRRPSEESTMVAWEYLHSGPGKKNHVYSRLNFSVHSILVCWDHRWRLLFLHILHRFYCGSRPLHI